MTVAVSNSGSEPCALCAQLSASAAQLCRDISSGRPRHRRSLRAIASYEHLYHPPQVQVDCTSKEQAELQDMSAGGVALRHGEETDKVGLEKLVIQLKLNDRRMAKTTVNGKVRTACRTQNGVSGFVVDNRGPPTPENVDWQEIVHHVMLPYVAPLRRVDDRLWETVQPFLTHLAAKDLGLHRELLADMQDKFLTDVQMIEDQEWGQAMACYSQGTADGPSRAHPLMRHKRELLEVLFRLTLADTLHLGHQAVRSPILQNSKCNVGRALIRHGIYWMEYRKFLEPTFSSEVSLLSGMPCAMKGMERIHVDFADENPGRSLCRKIANYRVFSERFETLNVAKSLKIAGKTCSMAVVAFNDLSLTARGHIEEDISETLESRGDLYRQALVMNQPLALSCSRPVLSAPAGGGFPKREVLREREVFVACIVVGARLEPILAVTCDTIGLHVNLSGILDICRPFTLRRTDDVPKPMLKEAMVALLRRAAHWYSSEIAVPKKMFSVIEDSEDDYFDCAVVDRLAKIAQGDDRQVYESVGSGYQWALVREALPDWLEHIERVTMERAEALPGTPNLPSASGSRITELPSP